MAFQIYVNSKIKWITTYDKLDQYERLDFEQLDQYK